MVVRRVGCGYSSFMTIGGSLLLIAAGAILKWAVTAHVSWLDLQTTGTVLFVVGLVGLLVALVYTFWWAQRARDDQTRVMPPPPSAR
jgi:heme/copper-type cytochrome/quinol oxidase subunit 2